MEDNLPAETDADVTVTESDPAEPASESPELLDARPSTARSTTEVVYTYQSGPMPSPETIAGYEAVLPGSAERLFKRMEKQSDHRMEMESIVVRGGANRSWAGLVAGVVVAITFLVVSAILISQGHEVAGTILGTVDLVALVTVFVHGERSKNRQLGQRQASSSEPASPSTPTSPAPPSPS